MKPPVDFNVKNVKKSKALSPNAVTTLAMSFTLALYFVSKFVWTPFREDGRYHEAKAYTDYLDKSEAKSELQVPSLATFGATAGGAVLYFTDWKLVLQYLPIYNTKFRTEE